MDERGYCQIANICQVSWKLSSRRDRNRCHQHEIYAQVKKKKILKKYPLETRRKRV